MKSFFLTSSTIHGIWIGISNTYRIHFQVGTRMYQSRSYLSILPDSSLTFAWQALLHVMVNSLAQIHRCKPWQQRQITYPTRSCTCIQGEPVKIQPEVWPWEDEICVYWKRPSICRLLAPSLITRTKRLSKYPKNFCLLWYTLISEPIFFTFHSGSLGLLSWLLLWILP